MAEIAGLMVRLEATTALLRNELRRAEGAVGQTADKITRDANRAEDALSNIGGALKSSLGGLAAGLSVEAVFSAIQASVSYAANLKTLAAQSGLTVQALQQMDGAFGQLGLGADGFQDALSEMLPNLGEALQGSGGAADAFNRLGVSLRDASGNVRSTDQILLAMADALSQIESPAERAGIASAVFGEEGGAKMAQALSKGSAAIRALMADVTTLSDEMIDRAAEIDREWNKLSKNIATYLKGGIVAATDSTVREGSRIRDFFAGLWGEFKSSITPTADAGMDELHIQLRTLESDLQALIDTRASLSQSPLFDIGLTDQRIESQRAMIAEMKALIQQRQDAIDAQAALDGLKPGGPPSNFGNSQGTPGQPFLRTGPDGKPLTQTNTLRFGAATELSWDDMIKEQEAEARKTQATAEQRAEAVRKVVEALKLESENLTRTAEDQELYNRLAAAGVSRTSESGQVIEAEVRQMQDRQRFADFWAGTQEADRAAYEAKRAVLDSIATPQQKYDDEMDRLNRLLNDGTLAYGEWAMAASLAHDELVKGNKALEKMSPEMKFVQDAGEQAFDRIGSGITNAFLSGEKAAVSFKNVSLSVISEIVQSFIELAAINPLKNLLFGTANATLSSVGGNLAGYLAGSSTGAANYPHLNGPNPPRAAGGPVAAGQTYLVGERRPELFTPDVSGRILPRVPGLAFAGAAQPAGDSFQLVQNLNFTTGIQSTVRAEIMNMMPTISNTARMGMMEAQARRGRSM